MDLLQRIIECKDEEFLDFINNGTVKTFTDYHLSARRKRRCR